MSDQEIEKLVSQQPPKSTNNIRYESALSKNLAVKYQGPKKISEMICLNCGVRWIGMRPENKPLVEINCPNCGRTGAVIETGDEYTDSETKN